MADAAQSSSWADNDFAPVRQVFQGSGFNLGNISFAPDGSIVEQMPNSSPRVLIDKFGKALLPERAASFPSPVAAPVAPAPAPTPVAPQAPETLASAQKHPQDMSVDERIDAGFESVDREYNQLVDEWNAGTLSQAEWDERAARNLSREDRVVNASLKRNQELLDQEQDDPQLFINQIKELGGGAEIAKGNMLQDIPELAGAITSGYRSREDQERIYNERMNARRVAINSLISEGKIDGSLAGLSVEGHLSGPNRNLILQRLKSDPQTSQHAMPVARPGTSSHERGNALDFSLDKLNEIAALRGVSIDQLKQEIARYGFHFDVPNDPVHASYRGPAGAGIGSPPPEEKQKKGPETPAGFSHEGTVADSTIRSAASQSAQNLISSQGAINKHQDAIQKSLQDKEAAEIRGLKAQHAITDEIRKMEDSSLQMQEESLQTQEKFTRQLVNNAQKKFQEFDERSKYLQARSSDPSRIFGFFDVVPTTDKNGNVTGHESEFKPFAALATVTAGIAVVANALLTIGSEGKIPMLASSIIFRLVNSDMQAQKTALTGQLSRLNSDVTMLGQAFKTTKDMDSAVSLVVEKRLGLVKSLLETAKKRAMEQDPSGGAGNQIAAIENLMNAANLLKTSEEAKRNERLSKVFSENYKTQRSVYESLKDSEHKRFQIQLGRERLDLSERSLENEKARLEYNRQAANSLTDKQKEKADMANSMSGNAIEFMRIWEKVGKGHQTKGKMHWLISRSGMPTDWDNYVKDLVDMNITKMNEQEFRFVQEQAQLFGPMLIRLLGEVGNLNQGENIRGINMFPKASDSYEAGVSKLYTIIGLSQLMGDDRFIRLPREEKRRILMSGHRRIGEAYYNEISGRKYMNYEAASKYYGEAAFRFVQESTKRLGHDVRAPTVMDAKPREPEDAALKRLIQGQDAAQSKAQ